MRAAKAIVAAVGMVVTSLTAILADDVINANEVGTIVAVLIEAVLAVAAVYGVKNAGFVEVNKQTQ